MKCPKCLGRKNQSFTDLAKEMAKLQERFDRQRAASAEYYNAAERRTKELYKENEALRTRVGELERRLTAGEGER